MTMETPEEKKKRLKVARNLFSELLQDPNLPENVQEELENKLAQVEGRLGREANEQRVYRINKRYEQSILDNIKYALIITTAAAAVIFSALTCYAPTREYMRQAWDKFVQAHDTNAGQNIERR